MANAFYAQSGGVTAVINASAAGVIKEARAHSSHIETVFAGKEGILGALEEALYDTRFETSEAIQALCHTPGGAFGSCRYKLKSYHESPDIYERLMAVFKAHDIRYFFYNGGGDSMDTALKIAQWSQEKGYPLTCIGIPKTIDNDLLLTHNCPGFGSVAKYVAISIKEAALDLASMAGTSTKVFILEVMGRHTGWIAAAGGLASEGNIPHIILFPEIPFHQSSFLEEVNRCVKKDGYCTIVASEGLRYENGLFISQQGTKDAFGHSQLGGVAPSLAHLIQNNLGYKYHWAVADYLQRSARHIASQTDMDQAYALGREAVRKALAGKNAIMVTLETLEGKKGAWKVGEAPLAQVANGEKKLPRSFINEAGFGITPTCREYLEPLIQGEAYPPYHQGIPLYASLENRLVTKKLTPWKAHSNLF